MSQKDKTPMAVLVNCAKCPRPVCNSPAWQEVPESCPGKIKAHVIKKATGKCFSPMRRSTRPTRN